MKATIQFIEKELDGLYPSIEIQGFIRLIFENVCQLSYTDLVLRKNDRINSLAKEQIQIIIKRLKKFEPIQYILGETEFVGLKITVNPAVLIPRPETEELVDWIIRLADLKSPGILDIGTGSGCIALAIKSQMQAANISAIDISEEALIVAKQNAIQNKLEVDFFLADILTWEDKKWGDFDVIVSNPPYVREMEKKKMHTNVLGFEPAKALFVPDSDPLIFYQRISEFAIKYLKKGGWLFFEINENLGKEMIQLIQNLGFKNIQIRKDINGKNRMLCGNK
ncbi:MAG: peptide chain release factor N(5)-glutamine methyltransferase [Prolixibacteraceae bacterium]|jgi:release factor glutamine methyltransferase|nr:peptide chain release factor N(5)-glutamine methyltransferase [Prolixibacteraceae bacterium]MBT6006631.1 peptide chain release factor N(5)-glutamine methyltransferase [Prolixibacteraceae bacterium]MBT6766610.1 peptide chain release factor N(5)-glutamine methyltransferase [Prolixibacteraceae bacterium]MBT7000328.1 peptide chain release factor N(5)-glutamine methyltransferase [Prolixibacteraceae bacterium]MBT7395426.1 peptide chain release factor N(5)-glutamine methyltransferase [Prolixibacter